MLNTFHHAGNTTTKRTILDTSMSAWVKVATSVYKASRLTGGAPCPTVTDVTIL